MKEITIADLEDVNPAAALLVSLTYCRDYNEFSDKLEALIDQILDRMAENPQLRQGHTEDEISIVVIDTLRNMGVEAEHTPAIGGHCDLVVRGKRNFVWLGEAKIDHSLPWVKQGYDQLLTRYSTGNDDQNRGGLLIYTFGKLASDRLGAWKDKLKEEVSGVETAPCPRKSLSFLSEQAHIRTGLPFKVRHTITSFYFDPQDKASGAKKGG